MAVTSATQRVGDLRAIVDMGSNGIRFSITDLSPSTARILPTIFQDRAGISLFDAQYSSGSKGPIPVEVVDQVIKAFGRFKNVCEDFRIPKENIQVIATEATRTAINTDEFQQAINKATGWTIEMLSKEDEGKIGGMGIASSFSKVDGLVLDLGGGSIQMSWISASSESGVQVAKSVSLPYGAAALKRRSEEAGESLEKREEFEFEIQDALTAAFKTVAPSEYFSGQEGREEESHDHAVPVFLSGGGFRGWGNLLMDSHAISPYPIPIINGFSVPPSFFHDTKAIESHIEAATSSSSKIFRISTRRQSQAPSVAILVRALISAVPSISTVQFAQGGVREGILFSSLSPETRAEIPLIAATRALIPRPSTGSDTRHIASLISSGIPSYERSDFTTTSICPPISIHDLIYPLSNVLYLHTSYPKESRAPSSLRITTSGQLAGIHGLSHSERACLALMLCHRWDADVPPTDLDFLHRMQSLLSTREAWWCVFVGRVGALVGRVYPAGFVPGGNGDSSIEDSIDNEKARIQFTSRIRGDENTVEVTIRCRDEDILTGIQDEVKDLEKIGKKKNWIGGKGNDGWGLKVDVNVVVGHE